MVITNMQPIEKHRNRKSHNQYFTPEFAVEKALYLVQNRNIKTILDPAVGNGVFLKIATKIWNNATLFGIDIDKEIISGLKELNLSNSVFICSDSLSEKTWKLPIVKEFFSNGGFDMVVGNPPFSSWFSRIETKEILSNYTLSYKNGELRRSQAIEILFLEIFIRIVKDGGFIVIVLPDGILSNPLYQYVREFILKNTKVLHIINLPRNVFKDTTAKTSILILQKCKESNLNYFVNIINLEKTGNINNAIKVIGKNLIKRMDYDYYYELDLNLINELSKNGISFKPLKDFIVFCRTGKTLYGKNRIFSENGLRFLHATNITDIGINYKKDEKFIDPLSKMYYHKAIAKIGDIVFVRVGVGCAGRVAIIDNKEDEGVATDYIHIFRVKDINPYFLVVYLKTMYGKYSINLLKHGVGTVSINKTDILSILIPIVPERIQLEIEKRYKNILNEYRKDINVVNKMTFLISHLEMEIKNLLNKNIEKEDFLCGNVNYVEKNLAKI